MTEIAETFTGTIEKLAFGGDGVLRTNGLVVFVPFTAPGDQIEGRFTLKKKHYARGEVVRFLIYSNKRTFPRCPYFGTCGGCQLQHIVYEEQVASKGEMVAEALLRIGKQSKIPLFSTKASPSPWTYRRHITLHLREVNGAFQTGYYALDNQTLLAVQECPIFCEESDPVLREIYPLLDFLKPAAKEIGRLTVIKRGDGGYLLALQLSNKVKGVEDLLKHSPFAGTIVKVGQNLSGQNLSKVGRTDLHYTYQDLSFEFSPFAFIQNHPEQSHAIYQHIVETVDKGPVFDLYCGVGVTTLLLARRGFEVVGIESHPMAVELARKNSNKLQIPAEFVCADAGIALKKALKEKRPSWIVVNPPREGLDQAVVETLCSAKVEGLIYVSCMPSTLARDTQLLRGAGYHLTSCQPFDMFPQTGHVETVAVYKNDQT